MNETIITEVDINKYVIIKWGENLIERCAGESENKFVTKADTYMLTVRPYCSISDDSWTVYGITENNINKHITRTDIVLPKLEINVTGVLLIAEVSKLFFNKSHAELSVIPNVPLDLRLPKTQPKHFQFISGHLSWATTTFVVLLIGIFVIAVGYYIYKTKYQRSEDAVPNFYVPVPAPSASVTFRSDPEEITATI